MGTGIVHNHLLSQSYRKSEGFHSLRVHRIGSDFAGYPVGPDTVYPAGYTAISLTYTVPVTGKTK